MEDYKRATVYFDPDVHQALRIKAATTGRSISRVVNEAVRAALAERAEELAAPGERRTGKVVSVDVYLRHLRQRGRI